MPPTDASEAGIPDSQPVWQLARWLLGCALAGEKNERDEQKKSRKYKTTSQRSRDPKEKQQRSNRLYNYTSYSEISKEYSFSFEDPRPNYSISQTFSKVYPFSYVVVCYSYVVTEFPEGNTVVVRHTVYAFFHWSPYSSF